MKHKLILLAMASALTGCGGGGGSVSSSPAATSNHLDGLYVNDTDLTIMLIDTDLAKNAVLVGDYVNSEILVSNTHTISGSSITTKGLIYAGSSAYLYDPTIEATITATNEGANITSVINNTNITYSFDRTKDSASLAEMAGTHINPDDGSLWTVNTDGTFTVNGICIVTGTLKRVKGYYSAENVQATNCSDPSYNATDYTARVVTVEHSGTTYLLAAMANDSSAMWGSAPL
ncbi:hypothetical protein [Vibrio japonicus]|uniref:Lipoprotein n=1 Tax=Vibrio japonicus TaxID=1824638 RepID=A0ABY5LLS3_9VIBR|nr:hypothetical protein [Vibrio japonicus]UUM31793.1 hypothetical protein NP165_06585 [Vibrio japonicus]